MPRVQREANPKTRNRFEGASFINGRGEDDEHQEESGNRLKRHSSPTGKIARKLRDAESDGVPGFLGDDYFQEKRGSGRAGELRGPIQDGIDGGYTLRNPEADGDGGIEMAARNVAKGGNHDGDGETVRESNAEKAEAAGAVQVLIGADRAGAEENQGEGSDEFRDQLLRRVIHSKVSV